MYVCVHTCVMRPAGRLSNAPSLLTLTSYTSHFSPSTVLSFSVKHSTLHLYSPYYATSTTTGLSSSHMKSFVFHSLLIFCAGFIFKAI